MLAQHVLRVPLNSTANIVSCRGKKDEAKEYKEYEKEEMFKAQQEMLEARRTGTALEGANQRRRQVAVRC
jgi:hypothetical protein